MVDAINLSRNNVKLLNDFNNLKFDSVCVNLFIITHLGQLKQMEALIKKQNIRKNYLLVLFTNKNLVIPQIVHNSFNSNLFKKILFLEIPFGVNRFEYKKLIDLEKRYKDIIQSISPRFVYLNSFEGHYSILISIAKDNDSLVYLVEEGTATYKICLNNYIDENNKELNYIFIKDKFMQTIGQTQLFKGMIKTYKNSRDFSKQSKMFIKSLWFSQPLQKMILKQMGTDASKKALIPATNFDKVYSAFPHLLDNVFDGDKEYFFVYDNFDEQELILADGIIKKYNIQSEDVIYLSQRYFSDSELYVLIVCDILNTIVDSNKHIFIKLHPKEKEDVLNIFKICVAKYKNRFTIIDDFNFLIEPVIVKSKINTVIGLTSTTLIYANLLSNNIESISIAKLLMTELRLKGCAEMEVFRLLDSHLDILNLFNKVLII